MRLLTRRVGPGDQRPGLSHPEAKLSEQSLTLAHPQLHPEASPDKGRQRLPVPQVGGKPRLLRHRSQGLVDLPDLLVGESRRSARPLSLDKPKEALFLEPPNPVFHGSGSIAQQPGDLRAGHPLGHQENAVEPVIVARIPRPAYLVLQPQHNHRRVGNREWFHDSGKARSAVMRNNL